ncbi:COR domain-containing protein [Winogradskyella sp.]|uniref:COR domain-containing protein n=1 Tax=Winogradskyella sp. TaxID=1883156 RepID=UPI00260D410C|nr:COR domain-containing protein [Winogradskyella sp.]
MDYWEKRIYDAKLYNLKELNLGQAQLKKIPKEVFELTKLKSLSLIRNGLTEIPRSISKLKNLEVLYLSGNEITEISEDICKLVNLRILVVNSCKIQVISDSISNLKNLEFLDIRFNRLDSLPYTLGKLTNLHSLLLGKNRFKDLSPELLVQNTNVILDYLKSKLDGDTVKLYEAKLLIVGEGEVGKTWLKERLIYNKIISKRKNSSTEGIDISKWNLSTSLSKRFRINLWDFGGQEIYHSTHQFFLTERSLYLLVFDARKDSDVSSFGYWLKTIKLLSNESPTVIVLNKIDERLKEIDIELYKEQFPNIIDFAKISSLNGKGRSELLDIIEKNITKLEHVGQELPKNWVAVRSRLESLKQNFISYDYYINICQEKGIAENLARELSYYYHILGVFLHFRDNPILKGMIFLNPAWATNAVYKVLDHEIIEENIGKFSLEQLPKIWRRKDGYPEENYVHLLELMKKFELCFQLPKNNWFIIPSKLQSTKPKFDWNYDENLVFEFKYDFMPAGIMTRLIVRVHEIIKQRLFWKSGVILEEITYIHKEDETVKPKKLTTKALILENRFDWKISIYLVGDEKRELLSLIRRQINQIHKTLRNPPVTELIACCCSECSNDKFPEKIKFDTIKQFNNKNVESFPCPKSGEQVSVSALLGDFRLTQQPINEEILRLLKQLKNETDNEESFIKKVNDLVVIQPNFFGIGVDVKKLIERFVSKKPLSKK